MRPQIAGASQRYIGRREEEVKIPSLARDECDEYADYAVSRVTRNRSMGQRPHATGSYVMVVCLMPAESPQFMP
jgi:hypothetical protein